MDSRKQAHVLLDTTALKDLKQAPHVPKAPTDLIQEAALRVTVCRCLLANSAPRRV